MARTKRQLRTNSDSKQGNGMSTDFRMSAAAADDIARRAYELYEERGCAAHEGQPFGHLIRMPIALAESA